MDYPILSKSIWAKAVDAMRAEVLAAVPKDEHPEEQENIHDVVFYSAHVTRMQVEGLIVQIRENTDIWSRAKINYYYDTCALLTRSAQDSFEFCHVVTMWDTVSLLDQIKVTPDLWKN